MKLGVHQIMNVHLLRLVIIERVLTHAIQDLNVALRQPVYQRIIKLSVHVHPEQQAIPLYNVAPVSILKLVDNFLENPP